MLVALFLFASLAWSRDDAPKDPLFASDDVLEATLTAPFSTITRLRSVEEEYAGAFRIGEKDYEVAVRSRGRFRREKDICDFPPIRLNFKKSQTKDTLLHGSDKVKLVTHCKDRSSRYEQTVVREYLAYRILNILTDASYGARLLRITYIDSEGKRDNRVSFGVVIEHRDRLAKRLDRDYLEIDTTDIHSLDPEHTNIVSVFQYLIGNTDFSPIKGTEGEPCCHNYVLFGAEGEPILSIPYDFDQSGIVDAPHAGPNPRFGLRSVKQRLYRGRCINNHLLPQTIDRFRSRKPEIEALINNVDGLSKNTRRNVLGYVQRFYKLIENPKAVDRSLIKVCLKSAPRESSQK